MSYQVIVPKTVRKEILSLPEEVSSRIMAQLDQLESTPRPRGCKKLKGGEGWRIRIGDYRILYDIDDSTETIRLRRVRHRRDIYR